MFAIFMNVVPWVLKAAPFLKGKGKLVMAGIVVLSLLGGFWYVKNLQNNVSELEGNLMLMEDQVEQCQIVNGENQSVITRLRGINFGLARAAEVSEDVRRAAALTAIQRDREASREMLRTVRELEELRDANPTCDQLSKIDMGTACPLIVERLRQSAAETNSQD